MDMREIIDAFLELSRINNKTFSREDVDISSLISEIVSERSL